MARITVEDSLQTVTNRFALTILSARRARQLLDGAKPLLETKNKFVVTALREIAEKKVYFENLDEVFINYDDYAKKIEEENK